MINNVVKPIFNKGINLVEISAGLMIATLSLAIYRYDLAFFQLCLSRLFLVITLIFFIPYLLLRGRIKKDICLIPLVVFLFIGFASIIWTPIKSLGLRSFFMLLEPILVFFLVVNIFSNVKSFNRFFKIFLFIAIIFAVGGGVYQLLGVFLGFDIHFPFINLIKISGKNIAISKIIPYGLYYSGGTRILRLTSFFEEPNSLGTFLILFIPFYILHFLSIPKTSIKKIIIELVVIVTSLIVLGGTISRSSILAFSVGLISFYFYEKFNKSGRRIFSKRLGKKIFSPPIIVIIILLLILIWHFGIMDSLIKQTLADIHGVEEHTGSFYGHSQANFLSFGRLFLDHPLALIIGAGQGGFSYLSSGVTQIRGGHNIFALTLAENGILGLFSLIIFFIFFIQSVPIMLGDLAEISDVKDDNQALLSWLKILPYAGLWVIISYIALGLLYGRIVFPFIWVSFGIIRAGYFVIKDIKNNNKI